MKVHYHYQAVIKKANWKPMTFNIKDMWVKWRRPLSSLVTLILLAVLFYFAFQFRQIMIDVIFVLGIWRLTVMGLLLMISVLLSIFTFTILVRGMGYPFALRDGYHSMNLSQVAAFVPGKIWGFAGLAGLLITRGVSKFDSVMIITLNSVLMISAAAIVGSIGLIPIIGWFYTLIILLPLIFLLVGHKKLDSIRNRFLMGSTPLPPIMALLKVLLIGVLSWIIVSASFAFLVFSSVGEWPASPLLIASAFPAGYIGGFVSLLAPSGIGIREGIITIILTPSMGSEMALSIALVFRIIQTAVIWLNIAVTFLVLSIGLGRSRTKTTNPYEHR